MEKDVKTFGAIILLLVSLSLEQAVSQDLRDNLARSLFSDQKANRVGDAVTVLVIETSSASNDAKTSTSRESDISLAANAQTGSASSTDVGLKVGTGNTLRTGIF
jgi:flagellar L-ring protein precursor FlgH